jgi:hypothetical protein
LAATREQLTTAIERGLNSDAAFEGLTAKQHLFVSLAFSGLSNAEAYRQAYDCSGMKERTIWDQAAAVAKHPLVTAKLQSLRLRREEQTSLAPLVLDLDKDWILSRVMRLAEHATKESVQLNALKMLGQTVGIDLFRETTVIQRQERTAEDIDRELKERLRALQPMIDGSAVDVTPVPGAGVRTPRPGAAAAKAAPVEPGRRDRRRKPTR